MENEAIKKVCSRCGRELPLSEFPKNTACRGGHSGICKKCKAEQMRDYRRNLAEKARLYDERWNAEKKVVEDIKPEDDEAVDVQKMISDALKGYDPEGDIEGFPVEVVAKMLERQYEQCKVVDVLVFENNKATSALASGFDWDLTAEGEHFWDRVIEDRDFSEFFKKYPKAEAPGAGIPSFKRFDPVLVRDKDSESWHPTIFSSKEGDKFFVLSIGGGLVYYKQCIPLNEDTERLIGTTGKYEG